ncbi:nickel-dependent hydrogenase large subunit [Candidatus Methylacidiphilum infernorum]|uniref:Ni,Fe-hydrogenase I large subunit n=1 Tax=Methylacidiphilum infernorum (isolate V4) TaxID=481448 RepID=B3DVM1_METI4|nr:nickel-dependent hydrogenase large subunit [Candidatus Methylacidiphilum infernorum]ACD83374.1 Ni,Fe-hydrogenase I large subunit [Methylacidiphilum infernorum V4]
METNLKKTPEGFTLDKSGRRIIVDPVTRIEGHLRCEVNVDSANVIRNAVSSGTMWRGIELIVKGRDPRDVWAFTQRICGVCTGVHALASVRAVENALGITIPENAHFIRTIMHLTQMVHDHLVHFYHLHALDWVDIVGALKADPKNTAEIAQKISDYPLSSPGYFSDVQNRLKQFVESGQLGLFKNGYWGHPAYQLPPEVDLLAVAHYLEALDFQRKIVKIHAVFGGKNPHPNWLVGGVPCAINIDETMGSGAPVNISQLNLVSSIIDRTVEFVEQVYLPDILAIGSYYKNWLYGGGLSSKNVLSYGEVPDKANDYSAANLLIPRGAIINGDLKNIHEVDLRDIAQIQEYVYHSWYEYPDPTQSRHPWDGITEPHFVLGPNAKGSKTNIEQLDEEGKYSWIKAPRFKGRAMEVGPLARFIIGYASGKEDFKEPIQRALSRLELPFEAMFSTLGRTLARALEAEWCAKMLKRFFQRLIRNIYSGQLSTADTTKWDPQSWPLEAKGVGFVEAPRGSLGHWIRIKNGKIENYQAVVPTTWNGSPRDPQGNIGAFEASLLGTPLAKPEEPLEILRTLHSFDPCLACSTHVINLEGRKLAKLRVV